MIGAKKLKEFEAFFCEPTANELAKIINHDEKPILFVDGEHEIEYHVPHINRKCKECHSWDQWIYLESDWKCADTTEKWISFKCLGRVFDSDLLDERKCENTMRIPLDESLRIKGVKS